MNQIEIKGQKYEVFFTWETHMGIRQRVYELVGSNGTVLVSVRGFEARTNHLLQVIDKKTRKVVRDVILTDARGTLEIAKTGLPSAQG